MKLATVALALAALLPCGVAAQAARGDGDEGEERAHIDAIIRDSIGWALTKDRARLEEIITHDDDLFIFHPTWDATVVGWESFVPAFDVWMDARFRATHSEVREMRISFSRSGDVAWFSAILDDFGEWDGRPAAWKDTRWTGVLERRDGKWVIVQMHFSFASDRVLAEAAEAADGSPSPSGQ